MIWLEISNKSQFQFDGFFMQEIPHTFVTFGAICAPTMGVVVPDSEWFHLLFSFFLNTVILGCLE